MSKCETCKYAQAEDVVVGLDEYGEEIFETQYSCIRGREYGCDEDCADYEKSMECRLFESMVLPEMTLHNLYESMRDKSETNTTTIPIDIDTSGKTAYWCATEEEERAFLDKLKARGFSWSSYAWGITWAFCPFMRGVKRCFLINGMRFIWCWARELERTGITIKQYKERNGGAEQ